ncbi:hypothetical protein DSO57_1011860 [Entomophthora muscae]|uniref:Uncharacterized protein n=1 Tax=Entomophthora muscae TaxID=34485 RepID=A0ACC2S856_9FUNG|nr:hypothetical protein DSO57_1011860 [Entomophthora muscae]
MLSEQRLVNSSESERSGLTLGERIFRSTISRPQTFLPRNRLNLASDLVTRRAKTRTSPGKIKASNSRHAKLLQLTNRQAYKDFFKYKRRKHHHKKSPMWYIKPKNKCIPHQYIPDNQSNPLRPYR